MRGSEDWDDEGTGARGRWPLATVLAILAMAWAVLGWPWLSGKFTIPWDAKAHFQPQIQFLAQSLASGKSPFWAPFVFSGHPQIADPQSLIFSPPFLLLALVNAAPGLRAVDTAVLATVLAGMACLVIWFRDRGWHPAGALIAGLGFGFGAAMAWRIQHTGQVLSLAYLPMVLMLLDRALARRSWGYGAAAGIVAGFIVLGRDQVALLAVYLLAGYVAWRILASGAPLAALKDQWKALVAGGIGGAMVIAVPVLLTLALAAESNRPEIDFIGAGRGSLHPALLLTFIAPDMYGSSGEMANYWGPPSFTWTGTDLFIAQNVGQLYIGAVPLLFLAGALASRAAFAREVRFFTIALVVMLIYALGWYTPVFRAFHALLPGVALYRRPADAVFLIGFLAAIVAGYGAHRFMSEMVPASSRRQVMAVAGGVLAAFAAGVGLAVHFDQLTHAAKPLAIAAAIVFGGFAAIAWAQWLKPLRPVAAAAVLVAFTVADLAYSNGPGGATALPPAEYDVLEPGTRNDTIRALKALAKTDATRRDRVELLGLGFHWPNASLTHELENTLGYNPVRLGLYTRAVGAEDHIVSPKDRKFTPLFPSYRSPLADLLGLRFIASAAPLEEVDKRLKPGDLALVARTAAGHLIYENAQALPRVLYVPEVQRADFAAMLGAGWPEGVDFRRTVLLEAPAAGPPARRPGVASIRSYGHAEVVIDADGPDGGYVVLGDLWHPWWTAEVDGSAAPLLRANVLFRAVAVPPGRHQVRFVFRPVSRAVMQLLSR